MWWVWRGRDHERARRRFAAGVCGLMPGPGSAHSSRAKTATAMGHNWPSRLLEQRQRQSDGTAVIVAAAASPPWTATGPHCLPQLHMALPCETERTAMVEGHCPLKTELSPAWFVQ